MAQEVEPHIYAGGIIDDEQFRENVLAFAERHDMSMAGLGSGDRARDAFAACRDRGIDVMINPSGGKLNDYSAEEILNDETIRREFLGL